MPAAQVHDRRSTDTLAAGQYAPIEVQDPYAPDEKITVLRQLRSDPLARLHAGSHIDDAQYMAGRSYQRDWELAERGARAIDPTKEAVDGGQLPEPLSDSQAAARMRLIGVKASLGRKMHAVAHAFLIDGGTTEQIGRAEDRSGHRWANYYGKMLRDALDTLAVEYGFASEKSGLVVKQINRYSYDRRS